jgi:hypothetical protein
VRLPEAERAAVPRPKVVDYLLSSTHPEGRGKAAFFRRCGFEPAAWERLAEALIGHALTHDVARTESSPFGTRFVVEGTMETPSGRRPHVRTVWFIGRSGGVPRLVTAYPLTPR